jgi:hypothetical protein
MLSDLGQRAALIGLVARMANGDLDGQPPDDEKDEGPGRQPEAGHPRHRRAVRSPAGTGNDLLRAHPV